MKKILRNLLICFVVGFIYFYVALPPLNIHSAEFWLFISLFLGLFFLLNLISMFGRNVFSRGKKYTIKDFGKNFYLILAIGVIIVGSFLINFINSPMFMSKKYANRITVNKDNDFVTDIEQVDFTKLPLLDKASSQKLGDRVMGQMSDFVSQYYVSNLYTQINYNNQIMRVTPLEYASFIKWITNKSHGVEGYITVDSVSGEAKLNRLSKGMKYVPSGYFNDNLYRKLRFSYPTVNFGKISFEIDNNGEPYWVVPVIGYSGVELRPKVNGVIVLNAITGKSEKYEKDNIPTWIDIAYSAELIIEQVDDWGTYQGGFFNSIFGQKNVVNTTEGYNYLAMNDDIYLYTGLTSIVSDESNLGFILTNMRTGETNFYSVPGAEEFSAMASAEGAVQQMEYTSTFPLLINLNNRPTYLVSLKDDAGLVKMYGFVDVVDYQKVVVSDSSKGIKEAAKNYLNNISYSNGESNSFTKTITIKSITNAIIDGNTYYYVIDEENQKYKMSIDLSDELPFMEVGDQIKVSYNTVDGIIIVKKIN